MKKTMLAVLALSAATIALRAMAASFNMLSCCPGENTARQARFVWHSSADNCLLYIAKATVCVEPTGDIHKVLGYKKEFKPVAFRSSNVDYYKYSAEVSDLEPGTEYVYWVESGSEKSPVQKFKTGGTSGSYNFLWLSDVHSHPDNPGKMNTVELLRQDAEAQTASSGGIDFVLFSGDAVQCGSRYDNWQQWNGAPSVTNYTFAMIPGDKEYYNRAYGWYLAVKNNPPNGPDATEQEGCYWFLRDGVLFVGIDSLIHKGSEMEMYNKKSEVLTAQTNWFDRVVTSQRNKFRYLVVVQHDPWFVCSSDGFDKSRGNYDVWRHVFDKHKVDLALSGDAHNYIRSKPLRGDAENSDGTVYMVAGQIEESNCSATVTTDVASYGNSSATKYFACMGTSNTSCGAAWIEVRPTSLKVTEFWDNYQSPNYKQYDSFSITPKNRGWVYEAIGERAHTRYRFSVDAPRGYDYYGMQISEIQLLDENGNRISSGYTLKYDDTTKLSDDYEMYPWGWGEEPPYAADGDTQTKWLDFRARLSEPEEVRSAVWLEFCFTNPTKISGYRWYTANDDKENPGRTPVAWTLSAFDEGSDTVYILDKVEDYNPPTENKVLAYPLPEDPDEEPEEPSVPETPSTTTADGTYYVLSEGVNKYENDRQGELHGCVSDAKNVLSACTNRTNGLWNPKNCVGLYDSDVTWTAVRAQLNRFAEVAKSGDTVLFYQSSHGGYDCICLYDREYLADELAEDLMRFKSGVRVVVVIDACQSGSMFKGGSRVDPESGPWRFAASVQRLMDEMKTVQTKGVKAAAANGPTVGWITACEYDQSSLDIFGEGWSGGLFTMAFVDAWKSSSTDANGDGFNDFKEIFNIAAPQALGVELAPQTMNESLLRSVAAWSVRDLSGVRGKWVGGNGDDRFSIAANWADGRVPSGGAALDFSSVSTATTIEADVDATFGAVAMGTGVITFTGSLAADSFSDTSKIAVGENATVTITGDLAYTTTIGGGWMLDRLDGVFKVSGKIVLSGDADMKLAGHIGANGVAVANGLVSNGETPLTFRLNRSYSGDTARWVIGEEGLSGNSGFWMLANSSSSSAIIQPNANDFTIADWIGVCSGPMLTIDTTGWADDTAHVVTATAGFMGEGDVSVVGTGTLVCDYDSTVGAYDQTANNVDFNVGGSATLALETGSNIGTGSVTVGNGAALELGGEGTATMGGALSLQGGSRFVAGGALSVNSISLPDSGTVAVSFLDELAVNTTKTILSITGNGVLTAADLAKFSATEGYILSLGPGGKSLAATRYSGTWTGGMTLSVPSGGVSIGAAAFDISNASRENPVTVTVGDGGALAADSSNLVLSAGSLPEAIPGSYMALSNDVPEGYAAQFTTVGTAIYVNVVPIKWIEENAAKTFLTGSWSQPVEYGADARANILDMNDFTPYSASTGNLVTVEIKAEFDVCEIVYEPDQDAQAAACLSPNGVFQVWTRLGEEPTKAEWVDTAASGLTPVPGTEYTLRFTINYAAKAYSVEVKDDSAEGYSKLEAGGKTFFPLAFETNCVSKILLEGETRFTSLVGESVEVTGFVEYEEVALSGSSAVLDAAKAAWLNKLGAKATVSGALATVTAEKFEKAYLLNVDFTEGDFTYEFNVTDITVKDTSVELKVTLIRNGTPGPDGAAINGTLNFYGAATLEAFKIAPSKLETVSLSNESFGDGDTARATIEVKGETPPAFFNARIE